jgi:hypothetical protein
MALYRAYDAKLGRWLNRDPLKSAEIREGPNLHIYCGNSSVDNVDILGMKAWHRAKELACIETAFRSNPLFGISPSARASALALGAAIAKKAIDDAEAEYDHPDEINAFRHCLWACETTKAFGQNVALGIQNCHEKYGPGSGDKCDYAKDLINNATGNSFGSTGGDCKAQCKSAMSTGPNVGLAIYSCDPRVRKQCGGK